MGRIFADGNTVPGPSEELQYSKGYVNQRENDLKPPRMTKLFNLKFHQKYPDHHSRHFSDQGNKSQ